MLGKMIDKAMYKFESWSVLKRWIVLISTIVIICTIHDIYLYVADKIEIKNQHEFIEESLEDITNTDWTLVVTEHYGDVYELRITDNENGSVIELVEIQDSNGIDYDRGSFYLKNGEDDNWEIKMFLLHECGLVDSLF